MSNNVETKLAAARTRLILDKPFLGALVLRLPMVKADPNWCKTTATDARSFYYNEKYIDALSLEETQFVLAHEAMHCGLSHFSRRQHRVKNRWDVACDYAINPLLVNDGLQSPPGALYLPDYEDMTAEEIYPTIDENTEDGPMDQHLYDDEQQQGGGQTPPQQQTPPPPESEKPPPTDNGESAAGDREGESGARQQPPPDHGDDGDRDNPDKHGSDGAEQPKPLNQSEIESLNIQWQQRLAGAAQQAMQAGKLGSSMARLVDHLLQPQLPWRMLLARYMNSVARDDYSFARPSSRRQGDAILPSLHSLQTDITIVLDTSGSIGADEMQEFVAEVDALKGQLNARVTLHACDDKLATDGPWIFEAWETMELPETLEGGGGTRFSPAFDWASDMDQQPNIMVYFTDAEGEFPKTEPSFPVIWLVKGKTKVPWGQRIQLN